MNSGVVVMKRNTWMCRRRVQSGSSLFEVMIAVLVLSTGMLGVAAMQSTSLRNSQSAFQRSQAVVLTYAISDAMRANQCLQPDVANNRLHCAIGRRVAGVERFERMGGVDSGDDGRQCLRRCGLCIERVSDHRALERRSRHGRRNLTVAA